MKHIVLLCSVLLATGCGTRYADLRLVPDVELTGMMGTWYATHHIPYWLEKDKVASGDVYTLKDDGTIDIEFFFRRDTITGEEDSWTGRARVVKDTGNAHWRVCFFWPFHADYMIIDKADDYSWAAIGHPSRKYFWILSRERSLAEETVQGILMRAQEQEYDISKIKAIPQPQDEVAPIL